MSIVFHQESQTFHLSNQYLSYIIKVLPNQHIGQLYYGKAIKDRQNFDHLLELKHRTTSACTYEGDLTFSLEHIKQEYPVYGSGDQRHPAIDIVQPNGSRIVDLQYRSHSIYAGKPKLSGLPATYVESDDEATTLDITLYDALIDVEVVLSYTIYNEIAAITRHAKITNKGIDTQILNQAMSLSLDLPDKDYQMIELTGSWSRERHLKKRQLEHGIQSIYSMRGTSSNNFNPFIALQRNNTTEDQGEVLGFSFIYSGNFLASVEVDTYNVSRVSMGLHPHCFTWPLKQNESFTTPEAVMVYSNSGLNDMSNTFHKLYRTRLARGKYRDLARPILVNNWEGTYFDFDEDKIVAMAKDAKDLGIELFVLDDGWFGKRNDDTTSLGDWFVNYDKLPNGIDGLSKKITDLGIEFGLWFEPEMVNKESKLYQDHPEWMFSTPNRNTCHGRNQYVLNFANKEVVDHIYKMMHDVISNSTITYIKWDMNRCMSEVYSNVHSAADQGKVMHEYILGVYDLYERLINDFPHILFESCASGGARFDPGMLYYAPQAWTSDDTDAIERLKIQYGTSLVYPISSMGSHVSAIPNHQLLRNAPLNTRANVAYFGTFGYELDVTKLSDDQKSLIKEQISFMKEYRDIIQHGNFYRLRSPFEQNETIWMVVSKDQNTAVVGYYRPLQEVNQGYRRVSLLGLDENKQYHVDLLDSTHYGDELMTVGLITSDSSCGENKEKYDGTNGDYLSRIYVLKAV